MGQQIVLMGESMNEINHRMTELEQKRSDPPSQDPSFAEILKTTSSAPNVVYTPSSPSSAELIGKLEYTTSEVERELTLLQVKVTHPGISTTSPDLDLHFKQFFYEQLNMPSCEIDDQMFVGKMPQPNTVMITLSHHRFEVFLFRAKTYKYKYCRGIESKKTELVHLLSKAKPDDLCIQETKLLNQTKFNLMYYNGMFTEGHTNVYP